MCFGFVLNKIKVKKWGFVLNKIEVKKWEEKKWHSPKESTCDCFAGNEQPNHWGCGGSSAH